MIGLDSHDMHESVYNLSFQVTVQWTSLRWPGGTACPPSPSPPWTRPSSLCWRWPLSWAPRSSTTEVRRTNVILFIVPSEGRVSLNLFHNSTPPPHTHTRTLFPFTLPPRSLKCWRVALFPDQITVLWEKNWQELIFSHFIYKTGFKKSHQSDSCSHYHTQKSKTVLKLRELSPDSEVSLTSERHFRLFWLILIPQPTTSVSLFRHWMKPFLLKNTLTLPKHTHNEWWLCFKKILLEGDFNMWKLELYFCID